MCRKVVGDKIDAFWCDEGPTTPWLDLREQRDDEESLFRRVQEVNKEVPVDMPVVQVLRLDG